MNLTITFANDIDNPRELITTRKIGQGKYEVFHAHDLSSSHEYAVKIFPNDKHSLARCKRERELLDTLDHPNIIKHYPADFDGELGILVLDFENHGDFFDIVTKGGFTNELHMRSYFRQLIEGLEYLHSKGIAHLDLKLENLLMGREFQLLLIDFDQSQMKEEERMVSGGTNSYRAPEIREKKCANVFAADVYSAGVTLFAFKTGLFPFLEVEKERQTVLENYDLFVENNNDYWQMKAQKMNKKADFFSEDFKALINGMLEKDPAKRMTIQDIKASEWYNKPILSPEGLKFHMSRVLQRMKQ